MSIKDGIKFGIGIIIGEAIVATVIKIGIKHCDKAIERLKAKQESEETGETEVAE